MVLDKNVITPFAFILNQFSKASCVIIQGMSKGFSFLKINVRAKMTSIPPLFVYISTPVSVYKLIMICQLNIARFDFHLSFITSRDSIV